jgi:PAS domain S-box-containing protein
MATDAAVEVEQLRDCLDNLVGLMALPASRTGGEPAESVGALLDALFGMLRLGFVCVRVHDPETGGSVDMVRVAESLGTGTAGEIGQAIDSWVDDAHPAKILVREMDLSVASAALGASGEIGIVVAGSQRPDFATQAERLLLDVAAGRLTVSLQQARLTRESERTARLLVDSIPGLVALLTAGGEVEFVNRRILEYTGRTLEELKHWGTDGTVHAEDLPYVIEAFSRSIAFGSPYEIVQRLRRSDGVYLWFQNSGFPLRDSSGRIVRWCVLLTDIDERKRAEDALRESERESRQIVDSIPGFIATFTSAGEVEFVNRPTLEYFGKTLDELKHWETGGVTHPEDLSRVIERFTQAIESGDSLEWEVRARRFDGVYRWFQSRLFPLRDANGRVVRWYNLLIDIDERKRAEEALNRARTELAHVSRATTLSALTASIAHEVNQPLSGIMTNASTCLRMLDGTPPNIDGARDTARRTIRDAIRASDVIARLRALFTKREFALEPLDLNEATREVIALSSNDLQRNRIILQPELADDLPTVSGDRIQLQQVILNLLRNASDAMVDVHDRPRQLLIRTEREDDDRVRLTVRDAGTGLPPRTLDSLFDAFYTTKSGGMGIGLFVSRSIVERHQGRLWAEPNERGPGATFAFSIPRFATNTVDPSPVPRAS